MVLRARLDGTDLGNDISLLSFLNRGFLFGDGVFEVIIAFDKILFDPEAHFLRLRRSSELLDLEFPWTDQELIFEMQDLLKDYPGAKTYFRIMIYREGSLGLSATTRQSHKLIIATPAPIPEGDPLKTGVTLCPLPQNCSYKKKSLIKPWSYRSTIQELGTAQKQGYDDILWLNRDGKVLEAASANIFLLTRMGDSYSFETPQGEDNIFLGRTREILLSLLKNAQIPCRESQIFYDELPKYDEAFLCSTVRGLIPIRAIGPQKISTLRTASAFWHIHRLFLSFVQSQIGKRVDYLTGKSCNQANIEKESSGQIH